MKTYRKLFIIIIILFAGNFSVWSAGYFSGFFGTYLQAKSKADAPYVDIFSHTYLSTQINFSNIMFFRSSFYLDLLLENGDFSSQFGIETASISFKIRNPATLSYHFLSFLYKDDEPLGSGVFLQRYFGIELIDSPLMVSNRSSFGNHIYKYINDTALASAGFGYTVRFNNPSLFAFYVTASDEKSTTTVSLDFRSAVVLPLFVMDISMGTSVDIGRKASTQSTSSVSIDSALLRAGVSMVVGDRNAINVFFQAGLANFYIHGSEAQIGKKFSFNDLYFIFEPRFYFEAPLAEFPFSFNFTMYSMPADKPETLVYVDNPFGITATLLFDALNAQGFQVAVFLTASTATTLFTQIDYMVATSARFRFFNGFFDIACKIKLNDILKISDAYQLSIGYRYGL
ncbi:MAG: hypothetical protein ACRC4W_02990 [Treponemataceae bacterium]